MLPFDMCRWLVEDQDTEDVLKEIVDHRSFFYQQAFVEAVGAVATAIAQSSAVGSQGGPSNVHRFRSHHPPTFIGGGDPMVVDHWF